LLLLCQTEEIVGFPVLSVIGDASYEVLDGLIELPLVIELFPLLKVIIGDDNFALFNRLGSVIRGMRLNDNRSGATSKDERDNCDQNNRFIHTFPPDGGGILSIIV
jgi:hypothetical protein